MSTASVICSQRELHKVDLHCIKQTADCSRCERLAEIIFRLQASHCIVCTACRSSGADTDMDENFEGSSHAGEQSFNGGLSSTDFEGASLEVCPVLVAPVSSIVTHI